MKRLLLALLMSCTQAAWAQTSPYDNSIQATVDYMSLDAPDDLGFRYGLRLAHHFGNDRIVVGGSLSYLGISRYRELPTDAPLGTDRRQRFMADLTILYDVLKSNRHALRIGGGTSAWYRRDDLLRNYRSVLGPNGTPVTAMIQREQVYALNIGYHLTGEYEYLITPRLALTGRLSWANLNRGGISSLAGVGVGYRFDVNSLRRK